MLHQNQSVTLKLKEQQQKQRQEQHYCTICHKYVNDINDVAFESCGHGHSFHKNCMENWRVNNHTCYFCEFLSEHYYSMKISDYNTDSDGEDNTIQTQTTQTNILEKVN